MAESRPLPCNLYSWPRVLGLLPDQKLLVVYLWTNRFTSAAGCYQIPISMAAVELGLNENALAEALHDFQHRELILFDEKTNEIFVLDWFRFHKFATSSQNRQLNMAVSKIESESLRNAVLLKIKVLPPNMNLNSNKSFCSPEKKPADFTLGSDSRAKVGESQIAFQKRMVKNCLPRLPQNFPSG